MMKMIKQSTIILIICIITVLTIPSAQGLAINASQMQTKTSTLSGQIQVTLAQWDFEFDQDLYYWSGPTCAAGLALPQFTQAAVDADPCWAGCNFAVHGSGCGQPFNTSDPSCQAYCDSFPDRDTICGDEWVEIQVDEETPIFDIVFGSPVSFRFNWLKVEQGFKLELMGFKAHLTVGGQPTYAASLDDVYCYGDNYPDSWTQVCPSAQCFNYGTHFGKVDISPKGGFNDYEGQFSLRVRSFKTPEGPRALTPPADVPATLPLQTTPYHIPLQFGVPAEAYFAPFQTVALFQLTTFYCGMVVLQPEPSLWNRRIGRYALAVSTDPFNPIPVDAYSDIFFGHGSNRVMFVCPSNPDTPAILYAAMVRYTFSVDKPLSFDELHYITADIPRNETDWRIYRFGSSPENPPADPHPVPSNTGITEEIYTIHSHFPILNGFSEGLATNTMYLTCPNPANLSTTTDFKCLSGSSGTGTCIDFLFVHPSDPYPSTLTPLPPQIRNLNSDLFLTLDYGLPAVKSRSFSALLLLEYSYKRANPQYTLGSDWESVLSNCFMQLGTESPIGSIDGLWVQGTISPDQTFPTCELEQFSNMIATMQDNLEALRANPSDALTQRTKTDLDTFQEPWQGCNRMVQNVLMNATYREVSVPSTQICFDSDPTDPCCNSTGSWDGCCEARDVDANISSWIENEPSVNGVCGNPTCVSPLLSDYAYQTSFDELGGCLASLPDQNSGMEAYRQCLIDSFGEDYMPRSCVVDADCPGSDTYPGQIWCDPANNTCIQNYTHFRDIFFECLASSLPTSIRIAMLERNNWVSQADNLASLLEQKFGNDEGCLTDAGDPWSLRNWHFVYFTGDGCSLIPYLSADPTRLIPPWADTRTSSPCTGTYWQPGDELYLCGTDTVCNWDPDYCNSTVTGTSFCGVCDTPSTCLEITGVSGESECEQQSVCFLADGTVRTDLTPQQCADTFTCTMTCNSGACTSADQCEAQGYCQFREGIQDAIAGFPATRGYQATGFCTKPMQPSNDPDCYWVYPGSIPSSYGCVLFANCTLSADGSSIACTPNYLTKTSCNSIGGTWHDQQTTKEACLADTACQTDNGLPSLSRIGNTLLTPKSTKDCSLCGGESVTLSTWMPGRWLPGVSRSPTWLPRQNVSTESLISNMINFRSLFLEVYRSTIAAVSFQLENNLQCTYSGVGFSVQTSVCDCTTTGSVDCYPLSDTLDIGRGRVCPNTTVIITAYPAILTAGQDALSSRLINECVSFELLRKPAVEFARLPAGQVTTGFVHRPPERSRESFDVVVNDNGAIVGQLVGDSVELRFSSSKEESKLQRLQVCLAPSSSIPQDLAKYPVYDLAYLSSSGKFVPLGFTFAFNGSYVCGNVSFVKNDIPRQFAPVLRTANYQNEPNPRLSDGEVALMYVIASLYAILCAITLFQVIRLAWLGGFSFATPTNFLWLVFALMVCIRSIYFYLVAADVLGQPDQLELVDMWMIDLPTLLYLIGNLLIALSFLFLRLSSRDHELRQKRYFWMAAGVFILFLVLIFVATLLAFNFVVVTEQGLTGPPLCPTYDDRSTQASIIRTVYEAVILFVSLVIALIALIYSHAITKDLRDTEGSTLILRIGVASSVGIMTDSLAFLIYYAINDPHPYFAIVLIFTEILPIFFILVVLSTHQIKTQQSSIDSMSRAGTQAFSGATAGVRRESID